MSIVYTKHALEKLERPDIKKFKITKATISNVLRKPQFSSKTKYGNYAVLSKLNTSHDLRVIYDILYEDIKIITFHIGRKGRYS